MSTDEYGRTWRYSTTTDVNNHTTITRGRMYRLNNPDSWSDYWEGMDAIAFYDNGFRGLDIPDWADEEQSKRATVAYSTEQDNLPGSDGALDRLAARLTGQTDKRDQPARFISVGIDRGSDLYILTYDGDPDGSFRDEIEEVNAGEVYRCETETYALFDVLNGVERWEWEPADDVCEEWYGEDKADEALAKMFPLTEFPADLTLPDTGE